MFEEKYPNYSFKKLLRSLMQSQTDPTFNLFFPLPTPQETKVTSLVLPINTSYILFKNLRN